MSATATDLSRSRTTPIRAITSTLSTRSSPSIPSASQTYEPLVKSVLRHRLIYRIFLYSAIFCWIQTAIWSTWGKGGLSVLGIGGIVVNPLLPTTLLLGCVAWAVGALPTVVVRKVYLTANHTSTTSPSKTLQSALSKPSTLHAFIIYTASAILTTIIHTLMAYANEPSVYGDPRLTLFVKSRKHPHYLNGRFLFLLFSQITIASGFSLRNIMLDRFVFRASSSPRGHKWPFSLMDLVKTFVVVVLFTTFTLPFSMLLFGFTRMILPFLYKLPLLHLFLRPFTAHFLRGSWSIFLPLRHFSLLFRAWSLGLTTLAAWESSELLFDAFVSQPVLVAHSTADPSLTLISGISSSDVTFKHFAHSELKELAADQSPAASARRTALFGDQKYTPNLWSRLCRESLVLLGRDYQLFLRRGEPPALSPPPPPAPPASVPFSIPSTPTPLIKKQIFQSTKQSPIRSVVDSLASDGSFSQALDAGAGAAHLPELFKSVEAVALPAPVKEVEEKVVELGEGIMNKLKGWARNTAHGIVGRYAPVRASELLGRWRVWWTKERLSKVVEACLPNRDIDVLAIEVITHLTCASLTEDRYGVVQRDIPKILEALLSFLSAIEEYQREINSLYTVPSPDERLSVKELEESEALRAEVERAGEVLGFVGDGLKEGVARIVRTFGDKLLAFKFPPRTASKLQGFMDYC